MVGQDSLDYQGSLHCLDMESIVSIDQSLFLFLNGLHLTWLDQVMWIISGKWVWIPLYLFLLYRLWVLYKKDLLKILGTIFLLIVLTDQSSGLIKDTVKRPRPTHQEDLMERVHTVNGYNGGKFGFVSSHAANSFAIALFVGLLLNGRRSKWTITLLLLWASTVSYSRIYLGVHYPGDILGGAVLGLSESYLLYLGLMRWGHIKRKEDASAIS